MFITDLDSARAAALASRLQEAFPALAVQTGDIPHRSFDLLVNASPCGMQASDPMPIPDAVLDLAAADGRAADVVTNPERTRFLTLAEKRGLKIQFGREMADAQFLALGTAMGVIRRN